MATIYHVLYTTAKGLMCYTGNIVVFVNSKQINSVRPGVAYMISDTLVVKGRYGFANFRSVNTVVPDGYGSVRFFENNGVPVTVLKGTYGECVFLKETYINGRTKIMGYLPDGTVAVYEHKIKDKKDAPNPFYTRLDEVVGEWEDITEEVVGAAISGLDDLEGVELADILDNNVVT